MSQKLYPWSKGETHTVYCALWGLSTSVGSNIADGISGCPKLDKYSMWKNQDVLTRNNIFPNSFPIVKLPMPALVALFEAIPLSIACQQALVNKEFLAAFRSNVTWRQKCCNDMHDVTSIDFLFHQQQRDSWFEFYRHNALWKITIVNLFHHRGGCSISSQFSLLISPRMSVAQFLQVAEHHPKNLQRGRDFRPFSKKDDLFRTGLHREDEKTEEPGPNCRFDASNLESSVHEAGLCEGAVLSQPEMRMRD